MHNEGYSSMCGHAVIALGRYAVDFGLISGSKNEDDGEKQIKKNRNRMKMIRISLLYVYNVHVV